MSEAVFIKGERVLYHNTGPWRVVRARAKRDSKKGSVRTCYDIKWDTNDEPPKSSLMSCVAGKNLTKFQAGNGNGGAAVSVVPGPVVVDSLSVTTQNAASAPGRVFVRVTHAFDGAEKRRLIAGLVLGDLGSGGEREEDELWLCNVILEPLKRYRGYKDEGKTIEQALLSNGLNPEAFRGEL